ncbi:MAG: hypothetical protein OES41_11845, partial [Rhodospirillales bacterium]|nr:hypothetical protein [Rhodospirillales bacterium]
MNGNYGLTGPSGVSLLACLALVLSALPQGRSGTALAAEVAGGLQVVGTTDYDLDFTSRHTEIEIRGDHVFVGSFIPLDENGMSAFKVGDVSDPSNPVLATHFLLPGAVLDTQVNLDEDRCGYGKQLFGLGDPACNTVLAATQAAPNDADGIWLIDARDPAAALHWGW